MILSIYMHRIIIDVETKNVFNRTVKGGPKSCSGFVYLPKDLIGKDVIVIVDEKEDV